MRAAQQEKCIECSMGNASMYLFCGVKGVSGRVSDRVSEGFPAGFPWGFRGFPGVSEGRVNQSGLRKSWFFLAQRTLGRGSVGFPWGSGGLRRPGQPKRA
jgi:hypothetical protein